MTIETTGNGEFNARDARRIASRSENPYISRFEKEIKQAAEDGDRGVLLCYTDCCSNAHGWIILYWEDVYGKDIPGCLQDIFRLADKENCNLVVLDRDAEVLPSLPTYSW